MPWAVVWPQAIESIKLWMQRRASASPPLRNKNTIITSFGTCCWRCVLLSFAMRVLPLFPLHLPKLCLSTFSHWVWKRSLDVFPDMSLLIQNPYLMPKDITAGPTSYPLQGTLWIANCSHVLHLLRYAHPSSSQRPGPVVAASWKFFGSETAQLVQGNHSLVGATYNTHF